MKRLDLDPTEQNVKKTIRDDFLNRNKYLKTFYELIKNASDINTIAIDGEWGSGKTFFAKQLCEVINCHGDCESEFNEIKNKLNIADIDDSMIAVYYDAWKNDNDLDPIISILCEISIQLDEKFDIKNDDAKNLITAFASLIPQYGNFVTATIDSMNDELFEKFKKHRKLEEKLQNYFNGLLVERCNKLVIFIDELDRCNPIFAIKLLERIKHYFANKNIIIVFTINSSQLQYSIKKSYGNDFDAYNYLDRFFDIRINLPALDNEDLFGLLGINQSVSDLAIKTIVKHYNMQLRQILHYKFLCNMITNKARKPINALYMTMYTESLLALYIAPLMVGIFINNKNDFNSVISGKNTSLFRELFVSSFESNMLWGGLNKENKELNRETKNKIAEQLYKYIFVSNDAYFHEEIGNYEFSNDTKNRLDEIISLLSDVSDFT